jgi:hypothetical protein
MAALSASAEQEFRKDVAVLASLVQSRLDEKGCPNSCADYLECPFWEDRRGIKGSLPSDVTFRVYPSGGPISWEKQVLKC